MPGEYSHEHPVTIHEGPMADKRGTSWREGARILEERNAERIQNPMKTPPNSLTSIDKAHTHSAKSDEGAWDTDVMNESFDDIDTNE